MTEAETAQDSPPELDEPLAEEPSEKSTEAAARRRPAPVTSVGRRSTLFIALAAGFALLAVLLAVMAVSFKNDRDDLINQRNAYDDIARIAGDVAAAMLQFDYKNPESGLPTIERTGATQFVSQYKESLPLLTESFETVQATQAATIKSVFIGYGAGSASEVSVIVIADLLVTAPAGQNSAPNTRLEMTMAKIDGQWKVTNVTNLNVLLANQGPQAPAETTTTTTTTAPPP